LTLLSAPGGFGKTAVLAEWLVAAPADEPVASARTGGPRRVCHSTTTMSRDLAFRSSCANTGEWSRLFPEPEVPMSRVQKEPLRRLRPEERSHLERVSRAFSLPAALVAREGFARGGYEPGHRFPAPCSTCRVMVPRPSRAGAAGPRVHGGTLLSRHHCDLRAFTIGELGGAGSAGHGRAAR
jgi:hypothetical protein